MLHLRLIILSVIDDVLIDSETLLVTDFMNLKIKSTQSFKNTNKDRICIHMFIKIMLHRLKVSVLQFVRAGQDPRCFHHSACSPRLPTCTAPHRQARASYCIARLYKYRSFCSCQPRTLAQHRQAQLQRGLSPNTARSGASLCPHHAGHRRERGGAPAGRQLLRVSPTLRRRDSSTTTGAAGVRGVGVRAPDVRRRVPDERRRRRFRRRGRQACGVRGGHRARRRGVGVLPGA
jgi:hypothetical protein